MITEKIPDWVTYPEDDWIRITPDEAGLDVDAWNNFLAETDARGAEFEGEDHSGNQWGTVLTRGGYLLHTWGDKDYKFQTASLGKAFTWAVFGLAADEGLVNPDDLVCDTWTGEGLLSHDHKYLNAGHHAKLTWRHLLGSKDSYGHSGGFPVTNGYYWRKRSSAQMKEQASLLVPEWANWTGDPFYDNYAHAEPGTVRTYSSGGIWRLSQSLTVLWDDDIKRVLDERIFSIIGVSADAWDWLPGRAVHENKSFYAHMPGYGDFIDPPYEVNGHVVRGGGGWVIMSAADLARFGHLIATQGVWKGNQIVSSEWMRSHSGGNGSLVGGESEFYTAMGKVTTQGIDHPLPAELFASSRPDVGR